MKENATQAAHLLLAAVFSIAASAAETQSSIEADWLRQQQLSRRSMADSVRDVLRRGRALAADLKDLEQESVRCLQVLAEVERRLDLINKLKRKLQYGGGYSGVPPGSGTRTLSF